MEKAKKNLKLWSGLYIFFALYDVMGIVLSSLNGDMDVSEIPSEFQTAILVFVIAMLGGIALIKLYLGVKGWYQAEGKNKNTRHIAVAKAVFVLLILVCFGALYGVVETANWKNISDLCSSITSAAILWDYMRQAKYLKENNA